MRLCLPSIVSVEKINVLGKIHENNIVWGNILIIYHTVSENCKFSQTLLESQGPVTIAEVSQPRLDVRKRVFAFSMLSGEVSFGFPV